MISLSPNHELLAVVSGNNASFYVQKSTYISSTVHIEHVLDWL